MQKENLIEAFAKLWTELFSSPVHLDSLLSKQPKSVKSVLARTVIPILLGPVSEAESFGVGVNPGEPWSLPRERVAQWRTARLLAERIYASLSNPPQPPAPMREDFPEPMIQEWESEWGEETARSLTSILAREAPLGIRAARGKSAVNLARELKSSSRIPVKIEVSDISPVGVRLGGYTQLFGLEAYDKGEFEIQDEGSQLMALFTLWPDVFGSILAEKPGAVSEDRRAPPVPTQLRFGGSASSGLSIIDACAGAGGKSLAMADALKGKGRFFSYDISATKLQALRRRATRAGVNNIQAVALEEGSEAAQLEKFRCSADIVLVDAPCSGWGVLRRNPDIKWRQDPSRLSRMPDIQLRLLEQYSALVKPGGRLVYGVCTFRRAETRELVEAFLRERNHEFELGAGGYLGPGPCDGFFMQEFRKRQK